MLTIYFLFFVSSFTISHIIQRLVFNYKIVKEVSNLMKHSEYVELLTFISVTLYNLLSFCSVSRATVLLNLFAFFNSQSSLCFR
jgi:hypothetical protein